MIWGFFPKPCSVSVLCGVVMYESPDHAWHQRACLSPCLPWVGGRGQRLHCSPKVTQAQGSRCPEGDIKLFSPITPQSYLKLWGLTRDQGGSWLFGRQCSSNKQLKSQPPSPALTLPRQISQSHSHSSSRSKLANSPQLICGVILKTMLMWLHWGFLRKRSVSGGKRVTT